MKYIITLLSLMIYLSSTILPTYAEKKWDDLSINHPYIEAIDELKNLDIIHGFPDGTFKPDHLITRAEALKLILKSAEVSLLEDVDIESLPFIDIEDSWYIPYIQYAVSYKIVIGYEDETFRPDSPVTRAEYTKILLRTKNIVPQNYEESYFDDIENNHWAFQYVGYLKENNILPNDLGESFKPNDYITRALASEVLYQSYFVSEIVGEVEEEEETEEVEEVEEEEEETITTDDELQSHLIDTSLDTGIGSYYHDKFNGRNTANGEIFDNSLMTVAHPYLPMHSMVRITNIENNKSVEARVNDCGPFSKNRVRVIDMSKAVFEEIGYLGAGLLDVQVEVLSIPEDGKFQTKCFEITKR